MLVLLTGFVDPLGAGLLYIGGLALDEWSYGWLVYGPEKLTQGLVLSNVQ